MSTAADAAHYLRPGLLQLRALPPLSVYVHTYGTGRVDEEKLIRTLTDLMDLSPRGIRKHLKLNRPIYARTAAYGHFGREPEADGGFSWEKLDLVAGLQAAFN